MNVHDLYKFEEFRKKFDPVYAKKTSGDDSNIKINWPEDNSAQFQAGDDDEDLYD